MSGAPRRPAAGSGAAAPPDDGEDRTVRRALRAGGRAGATAAVLGVLANAAFGGDAAAGAVWVATGVVVACLVTAGWLVLALLLDLVAGEVPGRRRALWTAAASLAAFAAPILPAAMLSAAGS